MQFVKFGDTLHPADQETATAFIQAAEGTKFDVKEISNTRTAQQNKAIYAFLRELATNLNNAGFDLLSFPWREGIEIPWDLPLAKERLWIPVQKVVAKDSKGNPVERTRELTREQVDMVYQPLARKITGMGVECPPMGRE